MATKPKAKPVPAKPRNVIAVTLGLQDNPDEAVARTLTKPEMGAAATIQR